MATLDPSPMTTYKHAEASRLVCGEFGWVTELDYFDDHDEPVELVEEVWERTAHRTIWHKPTPYGSCEVEDGEDECERDADEWWREGDNWLRVCRGHFDQLTEFRG